MASAEWYYAKDNKQLGPVSAAQLKQLANSGALKPGQLVWREGMDEWVAASKVKGLFNEDAPATKPREMPSKPAPPARSGPVFANSPVEPTAVERTPIGNLFDILLDFVRSQFAERFIESTSNMFTVCGHFGLFAAMVFMFAFGLIAGAKLNNLNLVLGSLAWVLGLAVLQYAARRFSKELDRLNHATGGTVASTALPDCFALVGIAAGVLSLLGVTVWAIQTESFSLIMPAVAAFILCQYVAVVALNPATLNIAVAPETGAGQEAMGVLSFLMKVVLRVVPVAFGVGVIWGTLYLLMACMLIFLVPPVADQAPADAESVTVQAADTAVETPDPVAPVAVTIDDTLEPVRTMAGTGAKLLTGFALLPLAAYVFFIFYHLLIDLICAALSLPDKIDALTEVNGGPVADEEGEKGDGKNGDEVGDKNGDAEDRRKPAPEPNAQG